MCRDALTELDSGEGGIAAAPAAHSVWTELCEQNWRVRAPLDSKLVAWY